MKIIARHAIVLIFLLLTGCSSQAQINLKKAMETLSGTSSGTNSGDSEIVAALKEALKVGISNGSDIASKTDGFFKNELIKIAVPPEARKVEARLRQLGMDKEVDRFLLSMNRAAEDAAKKSKPIFVSAITSMTVTDAVGILNGADTAATSYLKKTSGKALFDTFYPVVDSTLNLNQATKYYADLVNIYNKLPMVQKVNPDLKEYATQKAIDGLFTLVAIEEKKIREDPAARVTDLLKKVFGNKN